MLGTKTRDSGLTYACLEISDLRLSLISTNAYKVSSIKLILAVTTYMSF